MRAPPARALVVWLMAAVSGCSSSPTSSGTTGFGRILGSTAGGEGPTGPGATGCGDNGAVSRGSASGGNPGACQLEIVGCSSSEEVICSGTSCQCLLDGSLVQTIAFPSGNCSLAFQACPFTSGEASAIAVGGPTGPTQTASASGSATGSLGATGFGTFGGSGCIGGSPSLSASASASGVTGSALVSSTLVSSSTGTSSSGTSTGGTSKGGTSAGGFSTGGVSSGGAGTSSSAILPATCSAPPARCSGPGAVDAGLCSGSFCVCPAGVMPHSGTPWCVVVSRQTASTDTCADASQQGFLGEAGAYDLAAVGSPTQPSLVLAISDGGPARVRDQVTGLLWQARTSASGYTQSMAAAYCSALGGGDAGWRLPGPAEEMGLLDYGSPTPLPPILGSAGSVWTSAAVAGSAGSQGWSFSEIGGVTAILPSSVELAVRCVSDRGVGCAAVAPGEGLINLGFGTVLDSRTGLTWQQTPTTAAQPWEDALSYCTNTLEGLDGWRLPSVKELETLVDYTRRNPAIAQEVLALPSLSCLGTSNYWTSTYDTDLSLASAYCVDLASGLVELCPTEQVFGLLPRSAGILCVR